jgi:hypothetical protein
VTHRTAKAADVARHVCLILLILIFILYCSLWKSQEAVSVTCRLIRRL